jgi:hypothetical protein
VPPPTEQLLPEGHPFRSPATVAAIASQVPAQTWTPLFLDDADAAKAEVEVRSGAQGGRCHRAGVGSCSGFWGDALVE